MNTIESKLLFNHVYSLGDLSPECFPSHIKKLTSLPLKLANNYCFCGVRKLGWVKNHLINSSSMAGFLETWENIPWITRYTGAIATIMFALYCIDPYYAVFGWNYPNNPKWQVWRYILSVFSANSGKFQGLLELINFCTSIQGMELNFWKKRSSSAYYLLFMGIVFNIIGPHLGFYTFLPALNMSLAWTLAQESPFSQTTIIVLTIEQRYAPWVQLLVRLVLGGPANTLEPLMGIFAAHLFMFLTEHLPKAGGATWFARPPRVLRHLDTMEENGRKAKLYGTARKLGK